MIVKTAQNISKTKVVGTMSLKTPQSDSFETSSPSTSGSYRRILIVVAIERGEATAKNKIL